LRNWRDDGTESEVHKSAGTADLHDAQSASPAGRPPGMAGVKSSRNRRPDEIPAYAGMTFPGYGLLPRARGRFFLWIWSGGWNLHRRFTNSPGGRSRTSLCFAAPRDAGPAHPCAMRIGGGRAGPQAIVPALPAYATSLWLSAGMREPSPLAHRARVNRQALSEPGIEQRNPFTRSPACAGMTSDRNDVRSEGPAGNCRGTSNRSFACIHRDPRDQAPGCASRILSFRNKV